MKKIDEKYLKKIQQNYKKYQTRKWKKEDIETLKQLMSNGILSATFIYNENIFPNRSLKSIESKLYILRNNLGV